MTRLVSKTWTGYSVGVVRGSLLFLAGSGFSFLFLFFFFGLVNVQHIIDWKASLSMYQ